MFCPNCGQQQVSDDTRFCSRCGLLISGLAEWIASADKRAMREKRKARSSPGSPRRKGIRRGAKLMFLGGVLFPFFLAISIAEDHPGPLVVPFTVFFLGLAWLLYARIFGDDSATTTPRAETQPFNIQGASPPGAALPPANEARMGSLGGQRVRTAEIVQPPSVTEHTTKLLDNE